MPSVMGDTDLGRLVRMLDAAEIRHGEPQPCSEADRRRFGLPDGALAFDLSDERGFPIGQPYDGGYSGFYTEFVFSAAGALLAVWAWE